MELIEIDVICAEPPKASFCGRNQVVRFEIAGQYFSRQKNAKSLPLDGLAHDFFGSIGLGGVYEARAVLHRRPKRFDASRIIPSTESDFGDMHARAGQFLK